MVKGKCKTCPAKTDGSPVRQRRMENGKKNKLVFKIILLLLFPFLIFAQAEYVNVDNRVYDFLYRMETLQIIENYNSFEIPKTRNEIAGYLSNVIEQEPKLDEVDKKILGDLKVEFEYELYGTLNFSESIIGGKQYNPFGQNERYLFYFDDPGKANIFMNLFSEAEYILRSPEEGETNNTTPGLIGGEIRGTFLEKFGFFLRGYQGKVFGDKETARLRNYINYNFKFNLETEEGFFDETSGYLSADFDFVKFKLGRDRIYTGYGELKTLVGDNAPMFDYLSLKLKYNFLNFTYFHGKLIGDIQFEGDTITGGSNIVTEKFFGYHRLGFDISKYFTLGVGEIIIYGDRGIDLSYLNPFTFYKSVEHSNQDRDNSMLFFDFNIKPISGLGIFGTFLIDDIRIGEIGSGWWGNQTMLHTGISSFNLYKIIPVDLRFEYIRIEPYTFTHRLSRNNYTHNGYMLGLNLHPNSELFFTQINYRFNHRLNFSIDYSYALHGANPLNEDGSVSRNVGGDVNLGHRAFDSDKVIFLDGDVEYLRRAGFSVSYEPVNQVFFLLRLVNLNESLQNFVKIKETHLFFKVIVRI